MSEEYGAELPLSPLIRLERENNKIDPLFNMNLHVIKTSHLLSFTDMSRHRLSEEIPTRIINVRRIWCRVTSHNKWTTDQSEKITKLSTTYVP
jgi:hypothetical protein